MQPLELARMDELNRCYEIIEAGKRFQREQGFVQWRRYRSTRWPASGT